MLSHSKLFFSVLITFITFIIDQVSKNYVEKNIDFFVSGQNVFDGLNLVYVQNKGVSFGLLSELNITFLLGIISLIVSGYIIFLIYKSQRTTELVALSMILGGALGNGVDRINNLYVIDFIDIYYKGFHWPAFNFADSFITVGALIFFLLCFVKKIIKII